MVKGKSLGGGDDMAHMDETNALIERFKIVGGKQIREMKRA
jgi:hypothetical protein